MKFPCQILISLTAGSLLLSLGGCDDAEVVPAARPAADHSYQTAGEVTGISSEGSRRFLAIRHEAIPDFVSREGEVVGMESMVMQFEVDESLDTAGVQQGNRISFSFEVRFRSTPMLLITAWEPVSS